MDDVITSLKKLCDAFDESVTILKLILCIPVLDIVWSLYRIARSIIAKNTVGIVISVILAIVPVMWIADIICIVLNGKIWTMD